jgi:hypothetical protein
VNREQAQVMVDKLRAHADSVAGTPEAGVFHAKADELAAKYHLTSKPAPPPTGARRAAAAAAGPMTPPAGRTPPPMHTTTPTTGQAAPAGKPMNAGTLKQAMNPRIRTAFGKNDPAGTEIAGRIVRFEEEPELHFVTKQPKLNDDGTPRMVAVLIVQTDGSTRKVGPGLRKLYLRSGVADAVINACDVAGVDQPALDGHVQIRFIGLGEPPAPNFAAPKLFEAVYEPPFDQAAS